MEKNQKIYEKYIKRFLDLLLSAGALIVFSPVMIATAVVVKRNLGSPVLFSQERPGKDEVVFKLYKYRTMTDEKDPKTGKLLPDELRLTELGKKLRELSMDELPELWNILKGDMSIVGPRPLLTSYLPYYTDEERHRHDVRPGLTGLAQVNGRNTLDWDSRFAMDLEYVSNISFFLDLKIVLKTVIGVIKKDDILVDTHKIEGNLAEIRSN